MDRKTQKAKSKAKKVAKERAKGNPAFAKPTKEELELINKTINDKRQNIVQAMKSYYLALLTMRQASLFQERFEKCIDSNLEIKDEYGLPYSKTELEIIAQKHYMQLRFSKANVIELKTDILTKWGIDDATLEKYFEKWFMGNEDIDYQG